MRVCPVKSGAGRAWLAFHTEGRPQRPRDQKTVCSERWVLGCGVAGGALPGLRLLLGLSPVARLGLSATCQVRPGEARMWWAQDLVR